MADIRHRLGVYAPQDKVYAALSTIDGLAQWWTTDTRGESQVGKEIGFFFGGEDRGCTVRVTELAPAERVAWEVVAGPAEWVGTTLTFDLYPGAGDGETVVKFLHADWREPVEFMYHCSTKWAQFLLGMKAGLEGGKQQPYPEMPEISSWS